MAAESVALSACVGIDLGSTNCRVATWQHERVVMIPDEQELYSTPAHLGFLESKDDFLAGAGAKAQRSRLPTSTIHGAIGMLGLHYSDVRVQSNLRRWLFTVEQGPNDRPLLKLPAGADGKSFFITPEEVVVLLLSRLKAQAEDYLRTPITHALIGIPCGFGVVQRAALMDAAKAAGLQVLRLVNEMSLASMAFLVWSHEEESKAELSARNDMLTLLCDIGASKAQVALVAIDVGVVEMKQMQVDHGAGGAHMDQRLVNMCLEQCRRTYGVDLSADPFVVSRLTTACERARHEVYWNQGRSAEILVSGILPDVDFCFTLTQAKLTELCNDVYQSVLGMVDRIMSDASISPAQVGDLVFVGGASRTLRLQQLVSARLNGKAVRQGVMNPDLAVVYGAAVQAAVLGGAGRGSRLADCLLLDCISSSIGIEVQGGFMIPILYRTYPIPGRKERTFNTVWENQASALIQVFEGEAAMTRDNQFMGRFLVEGLPTSTASPGNRVELLVTVDVNSHGAVTISAQVSGSTLSATMTVGHTFTDPIGLHLESNGKDPIQCSVTGLEGSQTPEHLLRLGLFTRCTEATQLLAQHGHLLSDIARAKAESVVQQGYCWFNQPYDFQFHAIGLPRIHSHTQQVNAMAIAPLRAIAPIAQTETAAEEMGSASAAEAPASATADNNKS